MSQPGWIRMIEESEAEGRLRRLYEDVRSFTGRVPYVIKAFSLRPRVLSRHTPLYREIMFSGGDVSRAEREMSPSSCLPRMAADTERDPTDSPSVPRAQTSNSSAPSKPTIALRRSASASAHCAISPRNRRQPRPRSASLTSQSYGRPVSTTVRFWRRSSSSDTSTTSTASCRRGDRVGTRLAGRGVRWIFQRS